MRLMFGYPHGGMLWFGFHESIVQMLAYEWLGKKPEECVLGSMREAGSCHVPFNRNDLCRFFVTQTTDDYIVMIDTDIEFERSVLTKLANHITTYSAKYPSWDRENHPHIISGRVDIGTGLPVFYSKISEGEYKQNPIPFNGLKHFDAVGSGIIAISRFCLTTINRESGTPHWFSHREEAGKLSSDDFSFLFLARKHGFKPYGAWDIRGQHMKVAAIQPRYIESVEEFEQYAKDHPDKVPEWLKDEFYKPKEKKDE